MLGLGCLCRLGHSVRGRWPHGRWYTGELGPFPRRKKIPCSSSFPQRRGTGRYCEGILELYSRADGILNDVASNKSRKYTSFHSHDHRGYISIRSYVQEKKSVWRYVDRDHRKPTLPSSSPDSQSSSSSISRSVHRAESCRETSGS